MRAIIQNEFDGPEVLTLADLPKLHATADRGAGHGRGGLEAIAALVEAGKAS